MVRTLFAVGSVRHAMSAIWACSLVVAVAATLPLAAQEPSIDHNAQCKPDSKAAVCKPKSASQSQRDTTGTKAPASASDFAFPMDDSKNGTDPDGTPHTQTSGRPSDALPDMPTTAVPDPPASSERPLAGSSSSSGGDLPPGTSSSIAGGDPDEDIAPTTAAPNAPVKSARLKDLGSRGDSSAAREKLEQTRVADDVKVGLFYTKDGNAQGAYLRFKDAQEHAPDDPDVRFYLAESANRLNKRDEAVLNYQEYLRLDAGGDHDKAAHKALARLGVTLP